MYSGMEAALVLCAHRSKNDLLDDGVNLEMYNKVMNVAIKASFTFLSHTQTPFFSTKVDAVCSMLGWVWRPEHWR